MVLSVYFLEHFPPAIFFQAMSCVLLCVTDASNDSYKVAYLCTHLIIHHVVDKTDIFSISIYKINQWPKRKNVTNLESACSLTVTGIICVPRKHVFILHYVLATLVTRKLQQPSGYEILVLDMVSAPSSTFLLFNTVKHSQLKYLLTFVMLNNTKLHFCVYFFSFLSSLTSLPFWITYSQLHLRTGVAFSTDTTWSNLIHSQNLNVHFKMIPYLYFYLIITFLGDSSTSSPSR